MGGGNVALPIGKEMGRMDMSQTWTDLEAHMKWLFPSLKDVRVAYRWGGPVSVNLDMTPEIGYIGDERVIYANGCIGHGVSLTQLNGRLITDALLEALKTGVHRHARVNFANGDMVGHTGVLRSTIMAVEAVDLCLSRIVPVVRAMNGALVVTADHGNADEMLEWDKKKKTFALDAHGHRKAKTSHTLNAVPLYIDVPGSPLALDTAISVRKGKIPASTASGPSATCFAPRKPPSGTMPP